MRHVVHELASQGRHGDNALLHVSTEELRGLRSIARAAGTDLTVNPATGMPEAFNLGSLIKMLGPIAAGMVGGPMAGMLVGGGIGAATSKGNPLMGALSGAMGGYGGAGLAGALGGVGDAATGAATSALNAPTSELAAAGVDAANAALPQATTVPFTDDYGVADSFMRAPAPMDQMRAYEHAYANTVGAGTPPAAPLSGWEGVKAGSQALWNDPSKLGEFASSNMKPLGAIGMSVMSSPALAETSEDPGDGDNGYSPEGELWWDKRTPVGGMPNGIQRSRIRGMAQGGLLSLAVPDNVRAQGPQAVTVGSQRAPLFDMLRMGIGQPSVAQPAHVTPAPVAALSGNYLDRYRTQATVSPSVVRMTQPSGPTVDTGPVMGHFPGSWSDGSGAGTSDGMGQGSFGYDQNSYTGGFLGNLMGRQAPAPVASYDTYSAAADAQRGYGSIGDGPGGADGNAGDAGSSDAGSTGRGSDTGSDAGQGGDGTGSGGDTDGGGDSWAAGGLMSVGQYLRGPGDGMSDHIPAQVGAGGRPINVANNEYVVPADVVSHLGNGSSDAGAKVLDQMGAKVRKARTGNAKQGRRINPGRFTPA